MRLGDILRLTAQRTPRKLAVIADDRQLTYAEFDRQANRFAHFLASAGVVKSDRVACVLFNGPEYAIVHFGNARAGSILVHISPAYAAPEIARIVEQTRPRVLVADETVRDKVAGLVEHTLVVGCREDACAFERSMSEQPDNAPDIDIDSAAPVAMTFTGGTTGEPKGAVVSHTARYVSAWTTALEHRVTGNDVTGIVTPMYHAIGLMIWYQATVLAGCTSVIFRKWNAMEFIEDAERHGISSVLLVPVQARDLLKAPETDLRRLRSLRNVGAGGAVTSPDLIADFGRALPHCDYTDHYGQSETGPLTILKPWEASEHPASIGRPAVGVDLRIVDEAGEPVPPGTVGELAARGPFLMEGYFENEEETSRYFRKGDGWGWSGDLAVADENGFITLVGRSKEMIVSGALNIYPRELEIAIESHPRVEECAVFGVPDDRWGETPIACVVRKGEISPADLFDHCTGRLARYKRPREIIFVDDIPKTPSGKVQKPLLRDAYLGRQ